MAECKEKYITYAGLQELEAELEDLKVNKRKEVHRRLRKPESRGTYQKTLNTMQQKMNKETLKQESKKLKNP